ncbi:MAG: ABC transporter ATP-binding protein [Actinomycetota bacterium]|nr:ABC transporter ATP-binding protein [Actinomycetota bacterium]
MHNTNGVLIHAAGLIKRFGDFVAVDGIDFEVRRGEAFGFLGPNGAGKTSTMRMIGCTSAPTDGVLSVIDMDTIAEASQIKFRIGVVPQIDNLDIELSVRENLEMYARYFDIGRSDASGRIDELLDFVQLAEKQTNRVESLSGGMKRRLTIARALVNQPELLLLDEPTTGLDPQARHLVWDRLYRLKQRGVTLVITTHYMDEAEQLCDRLVIMDKAAIVAEGSPGALIAGYCTREVLELRLSDENRAHLRSSIDGLVDRAEWLPDRVLLYTDTGDHTLAAIHERGVQSETALVRRSSLEDVFLLLTGRTLIE